MIWNGIIIASNKLQLKYIVRNARNNDEYDVESVFKFN